MRTKEWYHTPVTPKGGRRIPVLTRLIPDTFDRVPIGRPLGHILVGDLFGLCVGGGEAVIVRPLAVGPRHLNAATATPWGASALLELRKRLGATACIELVGPLFFTFGMFFVFAIKQRV